MLSILKNVVKTTRIHPFRLFLLQVNQRERRAAIDLGVTPGWLSQVLNDRVDASAELYRDFVKYSDGAVTLRELIAFRKPSAHRRRKLVEQKSPRGSRRKKDQSEREFDTDRK
jgi:hypothetical protein